MKNTAFLLFLLLSFGLRAQDFYGTGVQEVKIGLPYQRWDQQLDSLKKANPDARAHGLVWVNGLKLDSVGVRYKGNSSYFKTRKDTYKKLPLNIKLDYKKRNQQLKGDIAPSSSPTNSLIRVL
jgi:spore coat protein CotH